MATHEKNQLDRALKIFAEVKERFPAPDRVGLRFFAAGSARIKAAKATGATISLATTEPATKHLLLADGMNFVVLTVARFGR